MVRLRWPEAFGAYAHSAAFSRLSTEIPVIRLVSSRLIRFVSSAASNPLVCWAMKSASCQPCSTT